MFRFLHLADLHLDTVFASRREKTRERLRAAVRKALERSVDFSISEDLDAVVIAGDLFDNDQLTYSTEMFIVRQIRRLEEAGIPVVYCTGNHDPGGLDNRASRIQWPSNCHLIDSQTPREIKLVGRSGGAVTMVAAGHDSPDVSENLAAQFPIAAGHNPYVGILHAHVLESDTSSSHKKYAPCSVVDLRSKGYAYWALGHIHVRQQLNPTIQAWYAGNIQGRTPRESGPKGGLVVSIDSSGSCDVNFREFGPVVWTDIDVELTTDIVHVDELARLLDATARKAINGSRSERMIRFGLSGSSSLASTLRRPHDIESLEANMRDVLGVLDIQIDALRLATPRDPEKYKAEPNVLGEALSLIDAIPRDVSAVAALVGDTAVIDWTEASPEMLEELLSGLSEELIGRMVKDA